MLWEYLYTQNETGKRGLLTKSKNNIYLFILFLFSFILFNYLL